MLRFLTAGESHGKGLTVILEGLPQGVRVQASLINETLARRQGGYGRGGRMEIEKDKVQILSGVRNGYSIGSPISFFIENKDWKNWKNIMDSENAAKMNEKTVTRPRPGHADLSGALKYGHLDIRNVLERSSARETAARVAAGSICELFLKHFKIEVIGFVRGIFKHFCVDVPFSPSELRDKTSASSLYMPDMLAEKKGVSAIDEAKKKGDSLGGVIEVRVYGLPPGLGSYVHYDRKLDGSIALQLMSINAIKGVEIGLGFEAARNCGSKVHDEIFYSSKKGFFRKTNRAGGIEGGMTNGEVVIVRAAMKPIPTLYTPLSSVDILTKKPFKAAVERSDVCAVPAASVVCETAVAFEIAKAFLTKFGGDSIKEIRRNYDGYLKQIKNF